MFPCRARPFTGLMTENTGNETVLVTGASGKTGRQVAHAAGAAGFDVRAASRGGAVRFDWYDSSLWDEALRGADAAYLAYMPDIGAPGADDTIGAFARRALELGMRRLVLLSARGEVQAELGRTCAARVGCRVDHRAGDLVHAEPQRGAATGRDARRRARLPGGRGAGCRSSTRGTSRMSW